jgi:hypothetical protein
MAPIVWLSLAQLEEEWARDFLPRKLPFTPFATLHMQSDEIKNSLERAPEIEPMSGIGDFHSWGGRVGRRLFQILAPPQDSARATGLAALSVVPLEPGEPIKWSILREFIDMPDPFLSRIVRIHNPALDGQPRPGQFALNYSRKNPEGSPAPPTTLYFATTAEEATEAKGFLRFYGVPLELAVVQIKEIAKGES